MSSGAFIHFRVRSVGRKTHAAGSAGAHIRYITRADAEPEIGSQHMPIDRNAARSWMNHQEQADRANARVCDKFVIALPHEIPADQRYAAIAAYCDRVTQGRVPYYFAVHQTGKDAENPHAHIVIRDRDIETGKRFMMLSDSPRDREKKGLPGDAVYFLRSEWAEVGNEFLERAGAEVRIDPRSLKAQGIDREPTIHEGPNAKAMEAKGEQPESRDRVASVPFNQAQAVPEQYRTEDGKRSINYASEIDQGQTRAEYNAKVRAANDNRERQAAQQAEAKQQSLKEAHEAAAARAATERQEEARRQSLKEAHQMAADREPRSRDVPKPERTPLTARDEFEVQTGKDRMQRQAGLMDEEERRQQVLKERAEFLRNKLDITKKRDGQDGRDGPTRKR